MDIDRLTQKLEECGLGKYSPYLTAEARPAIRFELEKINEDDIAIGASKMGGRPDLPASLEWPSETERIPNENDNRYQTERANKSCGPLSFIAQIDLTEVSCLDEDEFLPKQGFLYFFYTPDQDVWGFDPQDSSGFKVLFFDGDRSELTRVDFPEQLDKYSRFTPRKLNAYSEVSLPSRYTINAIFEPESDYDKYFDKIICEGLINKMLGYANAIQNEMELQCEMVANGLYLGTSEAYQDPRRAEFEARSSQWRLLLQVDSNDECGMLWGDVGRIYFWIRESDLLAKQFDKCWLIYQCC